MTVTVAPHPQATPYGTLYDPGVAKTELMGVESTRKVLGKRVDTATQANVHTVLTKRGQPAAVIVPMDWYRQAREALGDPTDL